MRKLRSQLLELDQIIKDPKVRPDQIAKIKKVVVHINYNPVTKNKHNLILAISSSMEFTNQYPAINKALKSYASFHVRKGMEISLLTTIIGIGIVELYYKLLFQVLPKHYSMIDTTISKNIFKIQPIGGDYIFGVNLAPKVTANIAITLTSSKILKRLLLSYWRIPIKML